MKKHFLYPLFVAGAAAVLCSCQPTELETESYQLTHTFLLTEDSTQGILEVNLHATLPVAFHDEAVLQRVREDLVTATFGEKYATCSNQDLLPRFAEDMYADYQAENLPYVQRMNDEGTTLSLNNEYMINITTVPQNDGRIYSCVIEEYSYMGGAHGVQNFQCRSYDLAYGNRLTERDLFSDGYEQPLTDLLIKHIEQAAQEAGHSIADYWTDDIAPNGNFTVHDNGLRYVFNPYEIAPYAIGETVVDLPFEELQGLLKDDNPANYLYN